jgi:anti-sigma regulatory factor (Ser/Thr protein kinase)
MADTGMTPGSLTASRSRESAPAWPLSSGLVLGALPTATPCARLHARTVMYEWGLATVAETVELVVSELITNAGLASRSLNGTQCGAGLPGVHLRLSSDHVRVLVEVWDANPYPPSPRAAGPDEDSGRGLMLVEALCTKWSWYATRDWGGKVVWAELRIAHEV